MVEFPIQSLRQFLMPDQVVLLKTFEAGTIQELDNLINKWVSETKNIIAIPGALIQQNNKCYLSLTYVMTVEGNLRD
jgi:hypothetical protein